MNDLMEVNLYIFLLAALILFAVGYGVYKVVSIHQIISLMSVRQTFILQRILEQYEGSFKPEEIKALGLQKKIGNTDG